MKGHKNMKKPNRGLAVKSLHGGRFIPPRTIRKSMVGLEERLALEFNERTKLRAQLAEQMHKYRLPLVELISKNQRAAEAVSGLRKLQAAAHARKRRAPHRTKTEERIFVGSFGATQVPPYDYQWTWSAVNGNPTTNNETADENSGDMTLSLWTDFNNGSSISGRAAVGIYFYPPAANGSLQIWSTPGFTDDWGDWCTLDGASADAWIGLYVGSYDLTGAFTGAVVDQQVSLWSDSSWWSGVGSQQGSNSGFGLYAPPIQVDQDHQYAIWVWVGGDVSAAGWGTFSGSGAGDDLNVFVPSITWELG
jgi:hypothetical protein